MSYAYHLYLNNGQQPMNTNRIIITESTRLNTPLIQALKEVGLGLLIVSPVTCRFSQVLQEATDALAVLNLAGQRQGFTAPFRDFIRQIFQRFFAPCRKRQPVATRSEFERQSAANAAGCSGDQDLLLCMRGHKRLKIHAALLARTSGCSRFELG